MREIITKCALLLIIHQHKDNRYTQRLESAMMTASKRLVFKLTITLAKQELFVFLHVVENVI